MSRERRENLVLIIIALTFLIFPFLKNIKSISVCSPQFALGISTLALGLSMVMWGVDKAGLVRRPILVGWFYVLVGFFIIITSILVFLVKICSQ